MENSSNQTITRISYYNHAPDLPVAAMGEDDKAALSQKLIDPVGEISAFSDYRTTVKRRYTNLARQLKLLTPMFEEIRDSKEPLPEDSIRVLEALASTLESAKELLRFGSEGNKIYLIGLSRSGEMMKR